MEINHKPTEPDLPDDPHRITLLMIMALLLLPLSLASYSVAVIAIIKGNFSVETEMTHEAARSLGLVVAAAITAYLGAHWYVIIRYYQAISRQLFGLRPFFTLYGLALLNILVFILTLNIALYNLPIYMIPLILLAISCYLIYLRHCALTGKPLK